MVDIAKTIEETNARLRKTFDFKPLSVSKCLTALKPEFDSVGQAQRQYEKNFNNPDSPYYQKTAEEIVKMWTDKADTSKHYGSMLDDYVGLNLQNPDGIEKWKSQRGYDYDERLKAVCTGFDQFYAALTANTDYRYATREQNMYIVSKASGKAINGRFDCLFYSPSTDRYLIIDWKTTEKIRSAGFNGGKFFGPCFNIDECNHNEYTLQTHFYKKALCETYGLSTYDKVDCYICQMLVKPTDNGKYFFIYKENLPFNTGLLDDIIDFGFKQASK